MSMSVSILSEASKDENESEEKELQELIWSLMSRSGLLSEMQGRISKFIEDNGKDDEIHVIPERADPKLLGVIFEYLQWVGMRQTNSVLLSESPVKVDLSIYESRRKKDNGEDDDDYKPQLYKLFEERNETEEDDRVTPSKSQNYSKDEFDDSKLTSCSGQRSGKANDNDNEEEEEVVEDLASDNDNEDEKSKETSSKKIQNSSSKGKNKDAPVSESSESGHKKPVSNKSESSSTSKKANKEEPVFNLPNPDIELKTRANQSDMLIDLNSPVVVKRTKPGVDHARPNVNVTVRQRTDNNMETMPPSADPFQSPRSSRTEGIANFSIPVVTSNSRLNFVTPTNPIEDDGCDVEVSLASDDNEPVEEKADGDGDKNVFHVVNEISKGSSSKSRSKDGKVALVVSSKEQKTSAKLKELARDSPEDDSTSDFMETLTMEDDTQDVSIASDSRGMSSCEHAVNLK